MIKYGNLFRYICMLPKRDFRFKDTHRLKVIGWKKLFHAIENEKNVGVAVLVSDKIFTQLRST